MPVPDPRAGYAAIWIVSCLLFFSLAFGGGCLVMYMILPESETTAWLPIAGVTLVCLPWFFWFLTCLYRILSRLFGFRIAIGFGSSGGGGGAAGRGGGDGSTGGGSHANDFSSKRKDGTSNNGTLNADSSPSVRRAEASDNEGKANNSVTSHESELPLTSSSPS